MANKESSSESKRGASTTVSDGTSNHYVALDQSNWMVVYVLLERVLYLDVWHLAIIYAL